MEMDLQCCSRRVPRKRLSYRKCLSLVYIVAHFTKKYRKTGDYIELSLEG